MRISDYGNPFGAQWRVAVYNTRTREHVCEGVEEEDMENREILWRRAGRTRAGTRWVRDSRGISKHDLSPSLSLSLSLSFSTLLRAVPLSSYQISFFSARNLSSWNSSFSTSCTLHVCLCTFHLLFMQELEEFKLKLHEFPRSIYASRWMYKLLTLRLIKFFYFGIFKSCSSNSPFAIVGFVSLISNASRK